MKFLPAFVFLAVIIAEINLEVYGIQLHCTLGIVTKQEWSQPWEVEPPVNAEWPNTTKQGLAEGKWEIEQHRHKRYAKESDYPTPKQQIKKQREINYKKTYRGEASNTTLETATNTYSPKTTFLCKLLLCLPQKCYTVMNRREKAQNVVLFRYMTMRTAVQ